MRERVSPSSRAIVTHALRADDRVLILGAGGWFGRTALDLIAPLGIQTKAIASTERVIEVGSRSWKLHEWDQGEVERFDATVVVDCAFLTRDRLSVMPLAEYVSTNRELTRRMVAASSGGAVRLAVTISSGAAVFPTDAKELPLEDNPYGYLKREAELRLRELATDARRTVISRAWSVSGSYVQHPRNYALADMILQALDGTINVSSSSRVFRRYTLADELLAVSIASKGSDTIDSGGDLVEMGELAEAVRATISPDATIHRPDVAGDAPPYYSDNRSWSAAVAQSGLAPVPLADQIRITAQGLGRPD